jgi:hypothetical protein
VAIPSLIWVQLRKCSHEHKRGNSSQMKMIDVPPSQTEINQLLDQAREDDLMIRTADGTQFVVSAVDDFDLEIIQTRKNEKLMAFLEERAKQPATIPLEDIERRLGLRH